MTAAPQSTPGLPPLPEPNFALTWREGAYRVSKPNIGDTLVYTADQLREDRRQIVELCAQQIPTNWLDDLLTGKDGLGQPPYYCPDIERLLSKLTERLRSLLPGEPK